MSDAIGTVFGFPSYLWKSSFCASRQNSLHWPESKRRGMLESMKPTPSTRSFNPWYLLLLLPYLGLCFPGFYARATPTLFGFPFFYWYQFSWVALASLLIAIVYKKTKP
jgi:hypothetical protein